MAQSTGNDSQLLTSIYTLIQQDSIQSFSYNSSTTPTKPIPGSQFWTITASGNTTQNISVGALAAGMLLSIYNAGSGSCTVQGSFYAGSSSLIIGSAIVLMQFQWVGLQFNGSGWTWIDGQFPLLTPVDNVVPGYSFGKLIHLPTNGPQATTIRAVVNTVNPPALNTWSSAVSATGILGVPAGAKAIRARALLLAYPTGAGSVLYAISFSDNNSNTPSNLTPHPQALFQATVAVAANQIGFACEIDIPLNASGQFYYYSLALNDMTVASSFVTVIILGYYPGN